MAMTDLPARLRAVVAEMRDETAWVPTVPAMTVSGWADDLDALLGALETEPPRCDAERCVCGHFQCVHRGPSYRGVYTCEECECRGFQAAGAVGRAAPPDGWQQEQSQMKLDAKFYGTIIKAKDATIVPDDEYVVFLAKDNAFADVLPLYIRACIERNCDAEQIDAAQAMYDRLCQWRAAHPERLKNPDAKGERLLPPVTERRAP